MAARARVAVRILFALAASFAGPSDAFAQEAPGGAPGAGAAAPPKELTEKDLAALDEADRVVAEMETHVAAGRLSEALALAKRALELQLPVVGESDLNVGVAYGNIGSIYFRLNQLDRAREYIVRSVGILESLRPSPDLERCIALMNLGDLERFCDRPEEALQLFSRVRRLAESVFPPTHTAVVHAIYGQGNSLMQLNRPADALPELRRAVALLGESVGPDDAALIQAVLTLSECLAALELRDEAEAGYERVLAWCKRTSQPSHPFASGALRGLALCHSQAGRFADAKFAYERALAVALSNPTTKSAVPDIRLGLAMLLAESGSSREAERQCDLAVQAFRAEPQLSSLAQARLIHGAGNVMSSLERYDDARRLFTESADLLRKSLGENHTEVVSNYNNLAGALVGSGQPAEALPLLERTLKTLVALHGETNRNVAVCRSVLAGVLRELGDTARADSEIALAVAAAEGSLGREHPEAELMRFRAAALRARQDPDRSAREMTEIIEAVARRDGADAARLAGMCLALGETRQRSGKHAEALALFDRALGVAAQTDGRDSAVYAGALTRKAVSLAALGRVADAAVAARAALANREKSIRNQFAGLSPKQRARTINSARTYLDPWLDIAPSVGTTGFEEVLRFKGIATRATAAERAIAREGGGSATKQLDELRDLERRVAALANAIPASKAERAAWRTRYAEAAAARDAKALQLSREIAPLRQSLERMDIGLDRVRSSLRPGEVLVDYLRLKSQYVAFVVAARGDVRRVSLPDAEAVEAAARRFTEMSADPKTRVDDPAWIAAGRDFSRHVLDPVRAALPADATALVICPDAALASVPFAALPASKKQGAFLADELTISTVSMAQDLVPAAAVAARGSGALVVGGVDYGAVPAEDSGVTRSADRAFAPLPGTAKEAEFVATRLGAGSITLTGKKATEAALRSSARGKAILHVATHGFVRADAMAGLRRRDADQQWLGVEAERQLAGGYDPMLLAGLAFAGASSRDGGGGDDGILTAVEASQLDLRGVDLVTLSACRTALGTAASGEGVVGLVQGFQMAGARSVVASLWPVDDEAARLLMEAFYGGIADGKSPAVALREASLHVRSAKDPSGRSLASPAHWAAFVCYGR